MQAFEPISQCAEHVIAENGLSDCITVVHKRSMEMWVGEDGDMPCRANILVTEVFDTELIGEGAISTFNHAHKHLLEVSDSQLRISLTSNLNLSLRCILSC